MAAKYPPMRAHWRHLTNMIELVHPSAHLSLQPKRQMDRFSRFSTAHDRKCLYFTMGPLSTRIALLDLHLTRFLGPMRTKTQTAPRSVQPFLHIWPWSVPILYNGSPISPSKLPLPMGWSGLACNTRFLGPTPVLNPNGNSSASAVLQGSLVWLTDRKSDQPRYPVSNNRPHILYAVLRCSIVMHKLCGIWRHHRLYTYVNTNNVATITSLSECLKHLVNYFV